MRLDISAPVLALEAGQVLALDDAAGTRIVARAGTVWVTEEGDREDHIVAAGQARVVAHGGRTLVSALRSACVALS